MLDVTQSMVPVQLRNQDTGKVAVGNLGQLPNKLVGGAGINYPSANFTV